MASTIPASSHSLAYRPPETVTTNSYGIPGDIYQCGLVLYQLLGGALSYDGLAWLNKRELTQLETLATPQDKEDFIDRCIKSKIAAGRAIDLKSLPPWVPKSIRRIINKACHIDAAQRFQSASAFMAKIHEIRPSVPDWQVIEGCPTLTAKTSFRVVSNDDGYLVQKRVRADWRNDNTCVGETLEELVEEIAQKA